MAQGREELVALMAAMRPRLHRYCARMMGSAFDGEDVVQDTLAKAAQAMSSAIAIERPESWLFSIAHHTALDALRHRRRQAVRRSETDLAGLADPRGNAEARVDAATSLAAFMPLSPVQRSCVVLMDVLGHSLAETGVILGVSVAAVEAALHRGRIGLKGRMRLPDGPVPIVTDEERQRLRAYADRFNASDFDALRALLAEDVRLDLVNRTRLAGRKDVGVYFGRYGESTDWRLAPGTAERRPALLVSDPADPTVAITYVVLLDWAGETIAKIRDFRFAPYIAESLAVSEL